MNRRKVIPKINTDIMAIIKYTNNTPRLHWKFGSYDLVQHHNPDFTSLELNNCFKSEIRQDYFPIFTSSELNICFNNEIENGQMMILFEYPVRFLDSYMYCIPRLKQKIMKRVTIGTGMLFKKNSITNEIDLYLSRKFLDGSYHLIEYHSTRYFGLDSEVLYMPSNILNSHEELIEYPYQNRTLFTVSNLWQDKTIDINVNIYKKEYSDFHYIVEYVNDFIQQNLQKNHIVDIPVALPLLLRFNKENRCIVYEDNQCDVSYYSNLDVSSNFTIAPLLTTSHPVIPVATLSESPGSYYSNSVILVPSGEGVMSPGSSDEGSEATRVT